MDSFIAITVIPVLWAKPGWLKGTRLKMLSFTKCKVEMPAFMVGSNSGTTRNIPIRMGRSPSIMFVKIGNYFISCIIGSLLVFYMVGK